MSNGKSTVAADGRLTWVRRLKDLIEAHEHDLGGTDTLSQAQRSLVRRAATLSVELERMEATFATAGQISAEDLDGYQRASNTLRRHLEVLGLKEQQRPAIEPDEDRHGIGHVVRRIKDDIDMYSTCVGRQEAKYDIARRIAYAVALAKDTGQPLPPLIAELAVKLRLADYADSEVLDAEAEEVTVAPTPEPVAEERQPEPVDMSGIVQGPWKTDRNIL
ncbi:MULTISPECIES: hypothetical protein [unclassified Mesorhizobium]|uniref:hypothetical protein n=1 Tax=unclassified Mesorhizobium TaxID=325217 RepID=UPI0015E4746E|nr:MULTISPECIES: hypothetical protein [unclassified Mesorhizobium]